MRFRTAWLALAIGAVCWGAVHAEGGTKKQVAEGGTNKQVAEGGTKKSAKQTTVIDCSEIVENLRAMRKAQSALMSTLVKKNESMAETLDLYAQRFSKNQGLVTKTEIGGLRKSAQSFRKHGSREQGIVRRFEAISAQLMTRLEACLQQPKQTKLAQRK